jgi:hypothetical protein
MKRKSMKRAERGLEELLEELNNQVEVVRDHQEEVVLEEVVGEDHQEEVVGEDHQEEVVGENGETRYPAVN